MIDIKVVIEKYPRSAGTRAHLASLLHDLFPAEKRSVNVALAVYDSGIATKLAGLKSIDSLQLHNFRKQLVDEYGLQEQFADQGIEIWANAYGLSIKTEGAQSIPQQPHQRKTTHNPDAYANPGVVVNGAASDYELEQTKQGVIISKFRGFDEADVIVPNTINGSKVIGIGNCAYLGCTAMKTLSISDGIEFIEDGAFAKCENLKKVVLPSTLTRIGSKENNSSYSSYSFGANRTPSGAFQNCGITEVVLPESLKVLGKNTFSGCRSLTTVTISNEILEIKDNAFYDCISLEVMILPERLRLIGNYAFQGCKKLSNVQFPLSLQEIGKSAFKDCASLRVVVLNEGLLKIGEAAFNDCESLEKILIPSTVKTIEEGYGYKPDDLFTIHSWYQPYDRRRNGWTITKKNPKTTIYCYSGSYALEYARKVEYPIQNAANLKI